MLELATIDVTRVIAELVESALRARGLVMRPIPYFERLDRFRATESDLLQVYGSSLSHFNETAVHRSLRSGAFADELSREVMRNFYPSLPQDGEDALRTIWISAVIIDYLLDEDGIEAASLASALNCITEHGVGHQARDWGSRKDLHCGVSALVTMLAEALADCQERAVNAATYASFTASLTRMLDAELASLNVLLDIPPSNAVRAIVRDKSVLLSRVGFQACCIGQQFDPGETKDNHEICDALGEILWIMDDLLDLEEDLERGVWNRTLWQLYDGLGETQFSSLLSSRTRLVEGILSLGIVNAEIEQIARRLAFLEDHPRMRDAQKVSAVMRYWLTAWLGIYR